MDFSTRRAKSQAMNGYGMADVEHGKGEVIVFVHGSRYGYRSWYRQIPTLAEAQRTIAMGWRHFAPEL